MASSRSCSAAMLILVMINSFYCGQLHAFSGNLEEGIHHEQVRSQGKGDAVNMADLSYNKASHAQMLFRSVSHSSSSTQPPAQTVASIAGSGSGNTGFGHDKQVQPPIQSISTVFGSGSGAAQAPVQPISTISHGVSGTAQSPASSGTAQPPTLSASNSGSGDAEAPVGSVSRSDSGTTQAPVQSISSLSGSEGPSVPSVTVTGSGTAQIGLIPKYEHPQPIGNSGED